MKSSFQRQFSLIVSLLLTATILIGLVFSVLFFRQVSQERTTSLKAAANSVAWLVRASDEHFLEDWDFRANVSVAATASQIDLLICDNRGGAQLCSQELRGCEHVGLQLSPATVSALWSGTTPNIDREVSAFYGERRLGLAIPVYQEDSPVCIVVASLPSSNRSLPFDVLRTFVLVASLVLALMILLLTTVTRREARPIQEMAAAARQIAHGNLSVRVPEGQSSQDIQELAVAFNNMASSIEHSETIRQEFVANVSHELKTPMTTIAGYLDGMLDGTIPPEKHRQYMELVSTEARRLARLVRNMLEIARLKDQGIPPEKLQNFDLCEAATQALLSFEQRITMKDLNVDFDLPEFGLTIRAVPDYVTQVLYNLIENAVKFINEGGTLSIRIRRKNGKAVISVANTGPTIPAEELPLIFDRFHKTDKSRSTDRDGVGLGLYIVKTIVMVHGEDIFVTSQEGRTEFTFTMPLSK